MEEPRSKPHPQGEKPHPRTDRPRPPLPQKPPVVRRTSSKSSTSSSHGNSKKGVTSDPSALSQHASQPSDVPNACSRPVVVTSTTNSHSKSAHNKTFRPKLSLKKKKSRVEELGLYAAGKSLFYVDQSATEDVPPSPEHTGPENLHLHHDHPPPSPRSQPPPPSPSPSQNTTTSCLPSSQVNDTACQSVEHPHLCPQTDTSAVQMRKLTPPKIKKRRSLLASNSDPSSSTPVVDRCVSEAESRTTWHVDNSTDYQPSQTIAGAPSRPAELTTLDPTKSEHQSGVPCSPDGTTPTSSSPNSPRKIGPKTSPKPSPRPSPKPPPRPAPKPSPRKQPPSPDTKQLPSPPDTKQSSSPNTKQLPSSPDTKQLSSPDTKQLPSPPDTKQLSPSSDTSTILENKSIPPVVPRKAVSPKAPSNSVSSSSASSDKTAMDQNWNSLESVPKDVTDNSAFFIETSVSTRDKQKAREVEITQEITSNKDPQNHGNPPDSDSIIKPESGGTSGSPGGYGDVTTPTEDENTCGMLKEIEELLFNSLPGGILLDVNKDNEDKPSSGDSVERSDSMERQDSVERQGSIDMGDSDSVNLSDSNPQRPPRPRRVASQLMKDLSFDKPIVLAGGDGDSEGYVSGRKPCPPKPKRSNVYKPGRSQSDVSEMISVAEQAERRENDARGLASPTRHQSFSQGDKPPPLPPRNLKSCSLESSEFTQQVGDDAAKGDNSRVLPPVPTKTVLPPGSQAPFAKPRRNPSMPARPSRPAPPPPKNPPSLARRKSLQEKTGTLERKTASLKKSKQLQQQSSLERSDSKSSSSENKPSKETIADNRLSKQYRKIEIPDTKKPCDVKEFSEATDDGEYDHDYHEIGPSNRNSPAKEVTPPPALPPRSYQPSIKIDDSQSRKSQDSSSSTPDTKSNRSSSVISASEKSNVGNKDGEDSASVSSEGVQRATDSLDVTTGRWTTQQRPVSGASQLSTNSSGSGDNFASPLAQDVSSESEEDECDVIYQRNKKERKIFFIAEEIKKSEAVFVDVLKLLNIDFRKYISMGAEKLDHPVVPSETLNKILLHLPQLYNFNEELLHDLEGRIENWKDKPMVADIFVKKGPFLKLYSMYIGHFETATCLLEETTKRYPEFQKLLREFECTPRCASLAIKHYMLKPIQRIPQYKLLLQDYLKHLSEDSADYKNTLAALEIVSEVADHANESMKHGDAVHKLLEIQHSLIGQFEVIQPGRQLLKHGELQKMSRKELQPRQFYLFNDVLLYTTPVPGGYRLKNILPLTGMKVSMPQQEAFSNEFSIISVQRSFTLAASTLSERDSWLKALNDAIEEITLRRHTFESQRNGPETSLLDKDFVLGHKAPLWVPDARVTMCMLCMGEFTITWRRHHCRSCGRVVCGYCSNNKAPLRYLKYKAARVCDNCFKELQTAFDDEDGVIPAEEVEEGATNSSPHSSSISLKHLKEQFQKIRKSGRKPKTKRPAVLKEVHANDEGSVISGYLRVLKNRKWKRLWFVVKDKVLYTYKASNDMAAVESLPLPGFKVLKTTTSIEGVEPDLVFQLTHSNTQPHVFQTDNAAATERWLTVMTESSVA